MSGSVGVLAETRGVSRHAVFHAVPITRSMEMTDSANYADDRTCKSRDVWIGFIVAAGAFSVLLVF